MNKLFMTYGLYLLGVIFFTLTSSFMNPQSASGAPAQPSVIVKLPENENAIIVEKKTQTLTVYTRESNGLATRFQAACSTGEVGGVKKEAGDKKTPEGIYFLKDEYEDKYLSPIYGQKAFPTDYPNLMDKRVGKNGSAIWLHGTNKKLVPMDSNGCVALENKNIVKLSDFVTLDSTPVIMVEEMEMIEVKVATNQENEISNTLNKWASAIEGGSYHEYLSFYSSDYLPDISWWEAWLDVREQADKAKVQLEFVRGRTGIYQHDKVFVVLFDCFVSNKDKKAAFGKRKLFLKEQNGSYKIVGDVFQHIANQFDRKKNPFVLAAKSIVTPAWQEDVIIETLVQWLDAWSKKDMDTYASFYADKFHSDGMNKKRWVRRKKILAKKYDFIHVSGRDFKVKKNKNTCEVVFFQEYESSGLTTQGTKRLKLVNKGGLWKIYQESWKEK